MTESESSDSLREEIPYGIAPRMAKAIIGAVLLGFGLVAVTYVTSADPAPWVLILALVTLAVLMSIQVVTCFPELVPRLTRHRYRILTGTQAVLTFAPFLLLGDNWLGMPGFLAASVLLTLPPVSGWVSLGAIVLATDLIQYSLDRSLGQTAYVTVSTVLTGVVVFGLTRLKDLLGEVQRSRAELARLAVARERLRFARDLHDLLGYSLSAITLKCELTYRLVPEQPGRAQHELTEILSTARQALSDVRVVSSGYREMSLAYEAAQAEAVLAAVGIVAEVRLADDPLPPRVQTVLATVLREGLTNMLRHSKADRCRISLVLDDGTARLVLENNGVCREGSPPLDDGGSGSGIGNLVSRVEALDGRLAAGVRSDGWFELSAGIPVPARLPGGAGALAPPVSAAGEEA